MLEYPSDRNIGLDSVVARQADYEKSGFKFAYGNLRFAGSPIGSTDSKNLVDLKNFETGKIAKSDVSCKARQFHLKISPAGRMQSSGLSN